MHGVNKSSIKLRNIHQIMAQSASALQEDEEVFFGSDSNLDTPNISHRPHEQPLLRSITI